MLVNVFEGVFSHKPPAFVIMEGIPYLMIGLCCQESHLLHPVLDLSAYFQCQFQGFSRHQVHLTHRKHTFCLSCSHQAHSLQSVSCHCNVFLHLHRLSRMKRYLFFILYETFKFLLNLFLHKEFKSFWKRVEIFLPFI